MKKMRVILLTVLMLVSLIFCSCGKATKDKVTLSEVTRSVFYAPQYAAINQGFFEEEGITLELSNGQGADKVMTAVISGQVDIGFSGPEACVYVYNEGKEDYAIVFAQLTKRDGSFLVGRKPEPDFRWENLKDKYIIGGRKGGVPEMTLEYVLRKHKLEPNVDLIVDTSVQFAVMAGAFTGGTGDYVALFEPTATMLEKEGKGYVLASIGQDSGEIPYTAYYAKKSYIEKNDDLIQRFTNAIYKGQKWVDTHSPREIAEAVKEFFPDTDIDTLENVAKRYKDIDAWNKDPVLKEASLELLQVVMEEAQVLDKRAPYDKIVTTEFAEKAIEKIK
ncbi:MAG: ABC transporter substrate-binding protein [Clostridiaceae bacterium]|jgi:NitT/TauT family transport system substrate-binding protein|nr:ABC transporter substrate-binding protein [Clostridiaceae bacterium]